MPVLTLFERRLWGATRVHWSLAFALLSAACGSDGPTEGADTPAAMAATARTEVQSQGQALGRKAPTLASTVYGVGCSRDADCAVIPTGDVCRCAGWGAVASTDAEQFLQRRARLGSRCSDGQAAACPVDPNAWAPRCRANQCVADKPHDFTCVDQALPTSPWPVHQQLQAQPNSHPDVLSACPFTMAPPEGSSQVWLLQPGVAGKYRIALTDTAGRADGPDHWFYLRTPDCGSDNVTCRWCAAGAERCFADEVLGPDDAVVVVVRNCDAHCVLSVGRWDPDRPLEPPL